MKDNNDPVVVLEEAKNIILENPYAYPVTDRYIEFLENEHVVTAVEELCDYYGQGNVDLAGVMAEITWMCQAVLTFTEEYPKWIEIKKRYRKHAKALQEIIKDLQSPYAVERVSVSYQLLNNLFELQKTFENVSNRNKKGAKPIQASRRMIWSLDDRLMGNFGESHPTIIGHLMRAVFPETGRARGEGEEAWSDDTILKAICDRPYPSDESDIPIS